MKRKNNNLFELEYSSNYNNKKLCKFNNFSRFNNFSIFNNKRKIDDNINDDINKNTKKIKNDNYSYDAYFFDLSINDDIKNIDINLYVK